MRIPYHFLAALLVLLTLREVGPEEMGSWGMSFETTTTQAGLAAFGFCLIARLLEELVARRAEWAMRWGACPCGYWVVETPDGRFVGPPRRHPLDTYTRRVFLVQCLTVVLYGVFLVVYAWRVKTAEWPRWLGLERFFSSETCDFVAKSYFVRGVLDIGPFALTMFLALLPRQRVLYAGFGRRANLRRWLSFEMRLTFWPLILWLVFCLGFDLTVVATPAHLREALVARPGWMTFMGAAALVLFAMTVLPWLVVRIWNARPMSDAALRDRMTSLLRRSGVKARAIMEWGPQGTGMANACVLGPWAPFRYILISPGLMQLLSVEECEAVIAHEIGHARYGHLGLFVLLVLGMAGLGDLIVRGMEALGYGGPLEQGALLLVLFTLYLGVLFGVVVRRCERQSDLAAAELMGTPESLVSALEKLARHSGNTREISSWCHDSVARRVRLLMTNGVDPVAMQRYHRRLRRMRWGLLAFSAVAIGLMLAMAFTDPGHEKPKETEDPAPAAVLKTAGMAESRD